MNIKSSVVAIATVSAALAISANAFAGELYGGLEGNLDETKSAVYSVSQTPVASFGEGEVYTAANKALDDAKGSLAVRKPFETTLAVGGELGSPSGYGDDRYNASNSSFAE
ncbi:MAG: hypothetical protein AB8C46_15385 [Burkholderiaceae bacterium]